MSTDTPEDDKPEVPEETAATPSEQSAPEPTVDPEAAAAPAPPATPGEETADDGLASGLTLGEGSAATEIDPDYQPVIRGKIDRFGVSIGTGRRKTSVARVRIKEGDGKMTINDRTLEEYFTVERDQKAIKAVLEATGMDGKVDVWARVSGGGTTGQTGAMILGIARAIQAKDPAQHHKLSENGFLTRDGRMVERKKYGLKKARKSFQFSKR